MRIEVEVFRRDGLRVGSRGGREEGEVASGGSLKVSDDGFGSGEVRVDSSVSRDLVCGIREVEVSATVDGERREREKVELTSYSSSDLQLLVASHSLLDLHPHKLSVQSRSMLRQSFLDGSR